MPFAAFNLFLCFFALAATGRRNRPMKFEAALVARREVLIKLRNGLFIANLEALSPVINSTPSVCVPAVPRI
jgi:hypothetical protein